MVATRNHPKEFPEPQTATPTESPRKRATRTSTTNHATPIKTDSPPSTPTRIVRSPTSTTTGARKAKEGWSHTPSNLTLIWLAISLPLVIWDTGYVLLRPYSMPGGFLHKPLWTPYELYGRVDGTYGFKAYEAHNGFPAAQGTLNALETAAYAVYLFLVYKYGTQEPKQGTGAPEKNVMGQFRALSESRTVTGRMATWVVLLGYSTAFLTFWKTVLYWGIEYFSGFEMIGHNDWVSLFFMWIVPNGAWLIFPGYMIYVFSLEILQGLEIATGKMSR